MPLDGTEEMKTPAVKVTQAVILAAGRGSRMQGLTKDIPKCLIPVDGRPILAWTLDALLANGIADILIVGGWQHEKLQDWAEHVRLNPNWSTGNMVRSLQLAHDWLLRAPTLVVYGDGAYGAPAIACSLNGPEVDWALPVDRLWLSLWRRRFKEVLDDAETLVRHEQSLLSIGARPTSLDQVQGQFMGLLRLRPTAWIRAAQWLAQIETERGKDYVDRLDMTSLLQALISNGEIVQCVDVDGGWVEIDSASDLSMVEAALKKPGFTHDFR